MSYADDIEVLEPLDLRETMSSKIAHMFSFYKKMKKTCTLYKYIRTRI